MYVHTMQFRFAPSVICHHGIICTYNCSVESVRHALGMDQHWCLMNSRLPFMVLHHPSIMSMSALDVVWAAYLDLDVVWAT
jgi:hypothetical protein